MWWILTSNLAKKIVHAIRIILLQVVKSIVAQKAPHKIQESTVVIQSHGRLILILQGKVSKFVTKGHLAIAWEPMD